MNFFIWSCSSKPADSSKNTNGAALPSIIGISGPFTSTYALSIPSPAIADMRCSMVDILVSPEVRQVDNEVSPTFSAEAFISTTGSKSTL